MVVKPARKLFTVDEYHRMAEVGIFAPGDRVELLDGEIIEMTPIGPQHAARVHRLRTLFEGLAGRAIVTTQSPMVLDDLSEPEPDLCLAHHRDDFYATAHPRPEDLFLVVEVAESSIAFDLDRKVPRYARAGIPETWVVDIAGERIEVFRGPTSDGYAEHGSLGRGDTLAPQALVDIVIDVSDVLGSH